MFQGRNKIRIQFRKSSDSSFDTANNYSWAGTGREDDADAHTDQIVR